MPSDNDIILSIGMNTQDAEESMKSFENASKRFSAALSQVMKLPNTNLERVIGKLRSTAHNYTKAKSAFDKAKEKIVYKREDEWDSVKSIYKEIAALNDRQEQIKKEKKLEADRLKLLRDLAETYKKIRDGQETRKNKGIAMKQTKQLGLDLPLEKDKAAKSLEKINKLIEKSEAKVKKYSGSYDTAWTKIKTDLSKISSIHAKTDRDVADLGDDMAAAQGRMTQATQEYLNTQQELRTAITVDVWQRPISSIAKYIAKLNDLKNGNNKAEQSLLRFKTVISGIWNDFKKLISRIQKFVKLLGKISGFSSILKGIRSSLDSRGIDWKTGLRYIIQYGLGFRSLFFLVRRLRSAIVDALEDMGKSIPRVQGYLDRISVSVNTLKGALGVALAPLLKVVAALMERLAAVAIRAANAIAQFFAVITGQNVWFRLSSGISSYTDAVKGSTEATKDNEKELKKQLADFDDIDVLVKDVGDDIEDINPGGSGGLDGSELGNWEEVARPMSKLAELIKEAWASDDVAQAFEEVGRYIGEYIQDALARLLTDFWPAIREKAEKVALAIAGTINGFFQTDAVVYFAKNIAAALNTALGTLSAYWNTVNWGGMGAKLQESIRALIDDIEWSTLAEYLKGKIKGILDFATNLLGDGSWITNLASNVSEVIKTVLSNVNFQQLGSTINVFLVNLLRGITNTLKENEKGVSKAVNDFIVGLNVGEILRAFGELLFTVFKMGLSAAFKLLASSGILSGLIIAWLTLELAKFVLPQLIISMLSGIIGKAIGTATGEAVGGAVVSGALTTAATKLFTLFSNAITFAFTGLGVIIAGLLGAAIIEAVSDKLFGPTSTPFEIMNNAIIQDTQALVQTAKFTITNSEPELVSAVSTILANMGYEIDTFNVTTVAQVNDLFAELMTGFGFNGAEITAMLKTLYSNLGYDLSGFTGTTVAELSAFMSGIMANTNGLGENVDQNASGIQEDVEEAATNSEEAVSTASEGIQGSVEETGATATEQSSVFGEAMGDMATAVADAASAIASTPIKPIIDTSSIDAGISKLQTFLSLAAQAGSASVSVPSMGSISSSIRHNTSSIAALAKGGVIPPNKPFLAMLGDQKKGTNIEAPLDTITQALQQALASSGFGGGSNREIVLNIDGTTLARLIVPYNLDELNRKGYNVRVLEGK